MTKTKISHITPTGANIFAELGFGEQEAATLQAQAQAEIEQTLALKRQLMQELRGWMMSEGLKQSQAAEILGVSRPRVSDVVNLKTSKFTLDALVQMLSRVGRRVSISVG